MAKKDSQYVCSECGANFSKWLGKCPECNKWNTIEEQVIAPVVQNNNRFSSWAGSSGSTATKKLKDIGKSTVIRDSTGFIEFDRVLGGGLTKSSVVLLGGDPGIGKSTILLQACANMANSQYPVLYVSGEESLEQIKARADRLGISNDNIEFLGEVQLENVVAAIENTKPKLVILDSIQTLFTAALQASPGTVSQVRECASHLVRIAKSNGGPSFFVIGHITKDGSIAGPKILEHMVDTVLYFEGESGNPIRMLRANKNRFGNANELGIFAMEHDGLKDMLNPSELLITPHDKEVFGSSVLSSIEGNRPFLIEIQALVEDSVTTNPKRFAQGMDTNRLQMLLAVLHKHTKIATFELNVYAKATGGVKIMDSGLDLPLFLSIYSSIARKPVSDKTVSFGEIGLAGEIRPVPGATDRIKEAIKLGFNKIIIPKRTKFDLNILPKNKEIEIIEVDKAIKALEYFKNR